MPFDSHCRLGLAYAAFCFSLLHLRFSLYGFPLAVLEFSSVCVDASDALQDDIPGCVVLQEVPLMMQHWLGGVELC
ncbi:unnamed protein product [Lathyrus oleraceus]